MNIITILQGIAMGIAELVPGLNAATLAIVLGIYEKAIDLLYKLTTVIKKLIRVITGRKNSRPELLQSIRDIPWKFCINLGIGTFIALIFLSQLLHNLLITSPQYVYGFFCGLILASLPVPWEEIEHKQVKHYLLAAVTFAIFFYFFSLTPPTPLENPSLILVFIGGILGAISMLLGSGGSTVLIGMGLYHYILGLVKNVTSFHVYALIPLSIFLLGMLLGFIASSNIIKKALTHYRDIIYAVVTGILMASLRALWPFFTESATSKTLLLPWETMDWIGILVTIFGGILTVLIFKRLSETEK